MGNVQRRTGQLLDENTLDSLIDLDSLVLLQLPWRGEIVAGLALERTVSLDHNSLWERDIGARSPPRIERDSSLTLSASVDSNHCSDKLR